MHLNDCNKKQLAAALGRAVRHFRIRRGMGIADLANYIGIARMNVYRIEKGRHVMNVTTAAMYAAALGVSTSALIRRVELEAGAA